ncbi:MAG: hypothetical protein JSU70_23365 [Phycisphaerales bacterium]|nr:MAG: hypothetical protein JSU70_23365 [Phycisphaerales bacterium]
MIFLTVGTLFPFDRLVEGVDEVLDKDGSDERVVAQVGNTSYHPRNLEASASLEATVFDKHLREADRIISHAGMGTIAMALEYKKPLLVMPRMRRYREHVNDHQVATAKRFEELGCLLVAYDAEQLPEKMEALKSFTPRNRQAQIEAVVDRIASFLSELASGGKYG